MKSPAVILPVRNGQKLDANYEQIFSYLNARHATIHLLAINDHTHIIYSDSAALRAQQEQVHKMTQFLKFEMLDRLALSALEHFEQLTFEYHVETDPLNRAVAKLRDQLDDPMLIVDQRSIVGGNLQAADRPLQYLVSMLEMPIWIVGNTQAKSGDIAIAVDLPAHNQQIDQLNRALLATGGHFAGENQQPLHLIHCWQSSGEQFMRSWLQLTEIDVARYAKVERQQRECQLQEYLADNLNLTMQTTSHVLEGPAKDKIAHFCQQSTIGLLILGHSQNPYGPIGQVTAELIGNTHADVLILPHSHRDAFFDLPRQRALNAQSLQQLS